MGKDKSLTTGAGVPAAARSADQLLDILRSQRELSPQLLLPDFCVPDILARNDRYLEKNLKDVITARNKSRGLAGVKRVRSKS